MATVQELFAEQAMSTPQSIAVSDDRESITFSDLNRRSNCVAGMLLRSGLEPEQAVAIVMRRSVSMVVSMLAVLKAGGTYLPIDERCPRERLRFLLKDADARTALVDEPNRKQLEGLPVESLIYADIPDDSFEIPLVPLAVSGPLSRAYIMYTSGSTGTPKGVEILHRGIVRLVRNTNYVDFGPSDAVAQVANPAFDAITFEVWGALLNGARLVILDTATVLSPQRFAEALRSEKITIMFLTASLFSVMASTVPAAFGGMKTLVVGGDAVNPLAARSVLQTAQPGKLVNGYGPTECTTFSVCQWIQSVPAHARAVPIGRPISNSEAFILNSELRPVAAGETGDLYLGGDGLARGYLNRPELTAERFIRHPFDATPDARLYKTGDRARYLDDGVIEFLGREDHQVKFHGFRIELGEIENALRKHPLVTDAAVKLWRKSAHDERLVGYVSAAAQNVLQQNSLRAFLAEELPEYMIPSHLLVMARLPLNAVGKVDRALLPDPESNQELTQSNSAPDRPSTHLESRIIAIWQDVLSLPAVGLDHNFFDLGGTSVTLALVEDRIRSITAKPFTITDLFRYPTVRALAGFLASSDDSQTTALITGARQRAIRQRASFRFQPR